MSEVNVEAHYCCNKCGRKWRVYQPDHKLEYVSVCVNCGDMVNPDLVKRYCDSGVADWLFWDQVEDQMEEDRLLIEEGRRVNAEQAMS